MGGGVWQTAHNVLGRAVEQGLARRSLDEVRRLGIGAKSFGLEHNSVSVMTDLDGSRGLAVSERRTREAANQQWKTLSAASRGQVRVASKGIWQPYVASTPRAEIVHDKFHVGMQLNEAGDRVRRHEIKASRAEGNEWLVGGEQFWPFALGDPSNKRKRQFDVQNRAALKTSRAWAFKDHFRRY